MPSLVFKRKGIAINVVVKSHDIHPSTLSNIHIKNAAIKIIVYEFLNSETDIISNVERTAIIFLNQEASRQCHRTWNVFGNDYRQQFLYRIRTLSKNGDSITINL